MTRLRVGVRSFSRGGRSGHLGRGIEAGLLIAMRRYLVVIVIVIDGRTVRLIVVAVLYMFSAI